MINHQRFKRTKYTGCRWDKKKKQALFDVRSPTGGRVREVKDFETETAAENAFLTFREHMLQEKVGETQKTAEKTPTGLEPPTLADYFDSNLDRLHGSCSASTKATNTSSFNNNLRPYVGAKRLDEFDEATCEDLVADLRAAGKSASTINLALRVLKKTLRHAGRRKLISELPENYHMVSEQKLTLEMSDDEQSRFFAAFEDREAFAEYLERSQKKGKIVKSARFGWRERRFGGGRKAHSEAADVYFARFRDSKRIFIAAIDLGLRISDLRLLTRDSVDLKARVVAVRATEKTKQPAIIALSDRCEAAIREALADATISQTYVFTTDEGKPYSEATLRRYFDLAKKIAGIRRRCRFNDLRHTFASNLVSEGADLTIVRDALGHTTCRMSERYAKPNVKALALMREALNRQASRALDTPWTPTAQKQGQ